MKAGLRTESGRIFHWRKKRKMQKQQKSRLRFVLKKLLKKSKLRFETGAMPV